MTAPAPTARRIDAARPCFLAVKLVHAGDLIPARVWRPCRCTPVGGDDGAEHDWTPDCDRHPPLVGHIVGQLPGYGTDAESLWTAGRFIERGQWQAMTDAYDTGAPLPLPAPHFWTPSATARLICARFNREE